MDVTKPYFSTPSTYAYAYVRNLVSCVIMDCNSF